MKAFFGFCLLLGSFYACAGEQTGKVTQIIVNDSGLHYFYLDGASSLKPACANISYWMLKDENSTVGKSQLSILLAAQASGRAVTVVGKNTCTRWPDGEDVFSISI